MLSRCRIRKAEYVWGCANFSSHALLHEGTKLALIVNLDDFLRPIGRVGDVELHLDGCARSRRRRGFVDRSRRFKSSEVRSSWDFLLWCSEISLCGRLTKVY